MVDFKTILYLIEAVSLIKEPPINAVWQSYQDGVNITQISDCPASNETCFIERVRNGNANLENAIIAVKHLKKVSIYCILQVILMLIHFLSKFFVKRMICTR